MPLNLTEGTIAGGDRIVVYGTGGIGKSTVAAWLPAPIFLDLERSTKKLQVKRDIVSGWTELRSKIAGFAANPPSGVRSLVIDSASVAEEFAKEHVVATRRTEKGKSVDSIEGFGFGKGWQFVYDEFVALLSDLDKVADLGFNVCLVAHDVSVVVPNPYGVDWLRWQPKLHSGDKRGEKDIASLVKNWCEHLLFIGYDVQVDEDGKGVGAGTRHIYSQELPTHVAKSRTAQFMLPFTTQAPGDVWQSLGIV
tara:strand:- start:703 stop:1455 length:753 start_codon:yes stop_codon:yes gene_type:complete